MGIQTSGAEFLMYARNQGVLFGDTLTLGKQNLFVSPIRLERLLKKHGLLSERYRQDTVPALTDQPRYMVDPLLSYLGASSVSAMDHSTYEGANVIHDLNQPIPENLRNRFDFIVDGGLLEHVFHFPNAIRNCMEMVRVGGHLCIMTVANNYFGHGFYQFSPELFYRIFTSANGFRVTTMFATTEDVGVSSVLGIDYLPEYRGGWYSVADPEVIRERVLLVNSMPTGLLILAQRTHETPIFASTPLQSDYVTQWAGDQGQQASTPAIRRSSLYAWLKRTITPAWKIHLAQHIFPALVRLVNPWNYWSWIRKQSLRNTRAFRKVDRVRK